MLCVHTLFHPHSVTGINWTHTWHAPIRVHSLQRYGKWFEHRNVNSMLVVIVRVRVVFRKAVVVGDWRLTTWAVVIFRVKWNGLVRWWYLCQWSWSWSWLVRFVVNRLVRKTRACFVIGQLLFCCSFDPSIIRSVAFDVIDQSFARCR